ncbi:hypothetical protein [Thermococcus henrietii]|uniref:hypothetical protein n=1 Tax=Thermococcus henrietii TaxID=2016361 RepID=UPI000C0766A1|nr:hypothetical protein [Thermococcus henrietii]
MRLGRPFSTIVFAFSVYFLYMGIIFTLARLPLSGDEPNLLLDLLPVVIGLSMPAAASLLFLRKTNAQSGLFLVTSTTTVTLASLITYSIITRNCAPRCDDDVVWFFLAGLVIVGFVTGTVLYQLAGKLSSSTSSQ